MARHFPGTSTSFLRLSDTVPSYPLSFSFWIKPESISNTVPFSKGFENAAGTYDFYYCAVLADSIRAISFGVGFAQASVALTTTTGTWYHVLLVFSSTASRKIWINGTLYAEEFSDITHGNPQNVIAIGGILQGSPIPTANFPFSGDISDVGYWTSALDGDDALALSSGDSRPGAVDAANLKGWWKLAAGDSLESTVAYLPLVAYGTVTDADDPPELAAAKGFAIYEVSRHDYLSLARTPAIDDPLNRSLHAVLPLTEMHSSFTDPIHNVHFPQISGRTFSDVDGGVGLNASVAPNFYDYDQAAITAPPVTVSFWVKRYSGTPVGVYWNGYYPNGLWNGFYAAPNADGTVYLMHVSNHFGNAASVVSSTVLSLTAWTHVILVITGDSYRAIYINGKKEAESTVNVPQVGPWSRFRLWADFAGGNILIGAWMRDLRIYRGALSNSEIQQLYLRGYAGRNSELETTLFPIIFELPEIPSGVSGVGAFAFTGYPAGLFGPVRGIMGEAAAFNLSGQNALFRTGRGIAADAGAYLLAEQPALLRAIRHLTSAAGAYDYEGKAADLELIRRILADHGIFTYSGEDALFEIIRLIQASVGTYILTGQDAGLDFIMPSVGGGRVICVPRENRTISIMRDPNVGCDDS